MHKINITKLSPIFKNKLKNDHSTLNDCILAHRHPQIVVTGQHQRIWQLSQVQLQNAFRTRKRCTKCQKQVSKTLDLAATTMIISLLCFTSTTRLRFNYCCIMYTSRKLSHRGVASFECFVNTASLGRPYMTPGVSTNRRTCTASSVDCEF